MIQLEKRAKYDPRIGKTVINKLTKAHVSLCENMERSCPRRFLRRRREDDGSSRGRCQSGGHRQVRAEAHEAHGRARALLDRRDS